MNAVDIETAIGWRGRTVLDHDGRKVGRLEEIYLDRDTDRPAWAALHTGLFGLRRTFVPLTGARLTGDDVQLPWPEELIKKAPNADPDVTLSEEEEDRLYSHYSLTGPESAPSQPHEGGQQDEDNTSPEASTRTTSSDEAGSIASDHVTEPRQAAPSPVESEEMPSVIRSEEELRVGKQQVASRLRLKKYVVTDEEVVPVRREEVRIERVPEDDENEPEVVFDSAEERERP